MPYLVWSLTGGYVYPGSIIAQQPVGVEEKNGGDRKADPTRRKETEI